MTATTDLSSALDLLRRRTTGQVITPADEGYDTARAAWNLAFEHRPAVVVAAETAADVVAAVDHARSEGLRIAVQTTGHGVARVADAGAMLIDLSRLVSVEIDPEARTATVGGGTTWRPVLEAAAAVGLAPLLGSTPDVGAVGYTLGGGLGWLAREHGLCRDTLRAAQLVTPDGDLVEVSAASNPELLWALRGGGTSGLGIVTSMTVDLVPATTVYGGNLLYPAEMAPEVMARYADWVTDLPSAMTSSVLIMNFPPFEEVPEPIRGRSFVIVRGCFDGPVEEGQALVDTWRSWAAPELDMFGPMPFSAVETISNDPVDPMPAAVTTEWLTGLTPEVIDVLCAATLPAGGPPALLLSEVRHVAGALGRGDGVALGRTSDLLLEVVAAVPTPEAEVGVRATLAGLRDRLAPSTTGGTYLNFTEGEEKQARSSSGFGPEALERLRAVKAEVDPQDVMSHGVDVTR
jgi:hypothetical protein